MKNQLKIIIQYLAPQHTLSRLCGKLSRSRCVWFKNWAIKFFIKRYHVSMDDALIKETTSYPSFHDFFIRELKPKSRPIIQDPKTIISPVDGSVSQVGSIDGDCIIQAKGFNYSLQSLLGGDAELTQQFQDGEFATLYLSPKDYHRVHMPLEGLLQQMIYVPGQLFSVNPLTANNVPNLFARNERVICLFNTMLGPMALILVGAMLVASIHTAWAGSVAPNSNKTVSRWNYNNESILLAKGQEMGYFTFGSTVILLFPPNNMQWQSKLMPEHQIKLGETLGTIKQYVS